MEEDKKIETGGAPENASPAGQNGTNVPQEQLLTEKFFEGDAISQNANSTPQSVKPESQDKDPNQEKLDWRTIVSVLAVLGIIVLAIWYSDRDGINNPNNLNINDDSTVKVSDEQEQGKVNIISEAEAKLETDEPSIASPTSTDKIKITAYYGNTKKNPSMIDCSKVFALEREADKKYDSDLVNTVRGMLFALTAEEKSQGYISAIPAGTMLKYVKILPGGVAEAHFTSVLGRIAGSCAVSAARAQIENTLKQFGYIKAVEICVEENCNQDEILQP